MGDCPSDSCKGMKVLEATPTAGNVFNHNEDLIAKLDGFAYDISCYLDRIILQHGEFPARCFYGESFTALLLYMIGK